MMGNRIPDETDRKILKLLSGDGRISWSAIGKQLGLSRTAVRKRISALEAAGMIRGYRTELILPPGEAAAGLDGAEDSAAAQKIYMVYFEVEKTGLSRVAEALQAQSEVLWIARLAGKENLTAMIRAENRSALREQVQGFAGTVPGIHGLRAQEVLQTQLITETKKPTEKEERADEQRTEDL